MSNSQDSARRRSKGTQMRSLSFLPPLWLRNAALPPSLVVASQFLSSNSLPCLHSFPSACLRDGASSRAHKPRAVPCRYGLLRLCCFTRFACCSSLFLSLSPSLAASSSSVRALRCLRRAPNSCSSCQTAVKRFIQTWIFQHFPSLRLSWLFLCSFSAKLRRLNESRPCALCPSVLHRLQTAKSQGNRWKRVIASADVSLS